MVCKQLNLVEKKVFLSCFLFKGIMLSTRKWFLGMFWFFFFFVLLYRINHNPSRIEIFLGPVRIVSRGPEVHHVGFKRVLLNFCLSCSGRSYSKCNRTLFWPGQDHVYSIWTYIPGSRGRWTENGELPCHAKCTVCCLTVSENDISWVMLRQLWNNQLLFTGILTPLLNCLRSKALPYLICAFECVGYSRYHWFSWLLSSETTYLGELSVLHQGKKVMIYRIWTNLKTVFILW